MRDIHWNVHQVGWTQWVRTELTPEERDRVQAALTVEQRVQLQRDDHAWIKHVGILWKPISGPLRRARFTHGFGFHTASGEFYVDSQGTTCVRPSEVGPAGFEPAADGLKVPGH
jgi:hypothetical protein